MIIGKNQYLFTDYSKETLVVDCDRTLQVGTHTFFLGSECRSTHVCKDGRHLVLLGYCVHTQVPELNCEQMCDQLLCELNATCSNVAEATLYWGGRWVAFGYVENCWYIWSDACGLKQCFVRNAEHLTAASQARYIAQLHNLPEDLAAVDYIQKASSENEEYCWPVFTTRYKEVKRLLPNHVWKQGTVCAERMNTILPIVSTKNQTVQAVQLLSGAMKAASNICPLAVTLTAGWDSRLVLAACKKAEVEAQTVTLQYADMPETHPDIVIAAQVAKKEGFTHQILRCEGTTDFLEVYMQHGENAHPYWVQMAQQTAQNFDGCLWVKGSCNEILRNPNGILYNWQITPQILCKLFHLPQTDFAVTAVKAWLADARVYCKKNHIRLLDLFYWEHRMGSWLAECLNEADIASDMFSPFNVRAYLSVGYQLPWQQRMAPNYKSFLRVLLQCGVGAEQLLTNRTCVKQAIKHLLKYRLHLGYGLFLQLRI